MAIVGEWIGAGGIISGGIATISYGHPVGTTAGSGGVKIGGIASHNRVKAKTMAGGLEVFGPANDASAYFFPYIRPTGSYWLIREVPGTQTNYQQTGRAYFTEIQHSGTDYDNKNMLYRRSPAFSSTTQKLTFSTKFHATHHEVRRSTSDDWTTQYYDEYFLIFQVAEWDDVGAGGKIRLLSVIIDFDTKFSGSFLNIYTETYDYDTNDWDSTLDVYSEVIDDYDQSFLDQEHTLVVQIDTTQILEEDRCKIYIDGVKLSLNSDWSSYPAQGIYLFDGTCANSTYSIGWVDWDSSLSNYEPYGFSPWYCHFVGTLAQTYFIEGAIVSPAQLAQGYSGPYGDTGFFLAYVSQDLGIDSSGNDNHFTMSAVNPLTVTQPNYPSISLSGKVFTFYCELDIGADGFNSTYTKTIYCLQQQGGIWPYWDYTNVPDDLEDLYLIIGSAPNTNRIEILLYEKGYQIFSVRAETTVPTTGFVPIQVNFDTTQRVWNKRVRIAINNVESNLLGYPDTANFPPFNYNLFGRGHYWDNARQFIGDTDSTTPYRASLYENVRNIVYVDGVAIPFGTINRAYSGPWGAGGFHLKFESGDSYVGKDSSPRLNDFMLDPDGIGYFDLYESSYLESTYGWGTAINFQLYVEDISLVSITIGLGFKLFSGEPVAPEVEFEVLVDGQEVPIAFKLIGSGELVPDIAIPFQLYRTSLVTYDLTLATALTTDNITQVVIGTSIPSDTPSSGYIQVVDDNSVVRTLHYNSWSGSTFTIDTVDGNEDFYLVNASIGNSVSFSNLAVSYKWTTTCLLNGTDISSRVVGDISIEQEEDSSSVMGLAFAPNSGSIDPLVYVGKPISITYNQFDENGALLFSRLRFTGKVADVEWEPDRRVISLSADTQVPATFNAMSKEAIASFIGGLWSKYVWSDEDDKSGWTYAQERLSTTYNCLYCDEYGTIQQASILAKATADFTFTDNERFHESLSLEYAQRAEMVNKISASITYSYQRLRHREISFNWRSVHIDDACAFLRWPGNWQLCQRSMVESAATSGTWVAISPIRYAEVWPAGCYSCPPPGGGMAGAIVGADTICWNIGTVSGFVNGEPTTVDPATGTVTENEGFAYDYIIDASHLCNGASWRAAARWLQDVDENYTLVIKCSDSISAIGEVATSEEYDFQNEIDNSSWPNSVVAFKSTLPAGYERMSNNTGDIYVNTDADAQEGTLNREEFEEAQSVILASAKGDIIRAHRLNTVTFTVAFQPSLNLSHTVAVDTPYLSAKGKVRALRDTFSIETGEASTEVVLAISRHNGSGLEVEDELTPIERPEPTTEPTFPSTVSLGTYIGGRDTSPIYDEDAQTTWQGFLTNYLDSMVDPDWSANPVANTTIAERTYPYSFVVRGPEISEDHTGATVAVASQEYEVVVPEDTLELIA